MMSGFIPWLMVRLPWGSRSTRSTFRSCSANATPRFSVVVVLATPPFWLANEITRPIGAPFGVSVRIPGRGSRRASPIEPLSFALMLAIPPESARAFLAPEEQARLREQAREGGHRGGCDHDHGQGRTHRDRGGA